MDTHQSLKEVFSHLKTRNLSAAINELEAFLAVHPHQVNSDRLHALRTDYQLMADYWKRGFKDPQLPSLYQVRALLEYQQAIWRGTFLLPLFRLYAPSHDGPRLVATESS